MPVSDILARISGLLLMVSSFWNGFLSFIYVLSLVWVCVGVMWFVPMLMAVGVFFFAVAAMAMGHQKWLVAGPILSLLTSMFNFNIIGILLDLVSLGLMIGSIVVRSQEDLQNAA